MNYSISDIKSENILAVMEAMVHEAYMTRDELAQRCQLSLTTVGKIINGLHDYGILSHKHMRTMVSGRTTTAFGLSDSAVFVIFRITEKSLVMEWSDLRMRSLCHIHQSVTPDRDPSETLLTFLLKCRREWKLSHKYILLCGLIAESNVMDREMVTQAIRTHLNLTVSVFDHTADAIARAAAYEGIADRDRCIAVLSNDGSCGGIVIYQGKVRPGAQMGIGYDRYNMPISGEELRQTIHTLASLFVPDTVLICSNGNTENLKSHLEAALRTTPILADTVVEVRNTDRILTLGMAIAMRLHWLEEMRCDSQRLRPKISSLTSNV